MKTANTDGWCVYLVLCGNGALYCGISNRPEVRFAAHRNGKGAKYTRVFKALEMRVLADEMDKSTALRLEADIKKLSAQQKKLLWENGIAVPFR